MSKKIIEIKNVYKKFIHQNNSIEVFKNLSFHLREVNLWH